MEYDAVLVSRGVFHCNLVANQLEYDAVLMSRGVFHYDLVANQLEYDAVLMSRGVFPCDVEPNQLECDTIITKFQLQSHYHVHFQTNTLEKRLNPLIFLPSYVINSTVLLYW